MPVWSNLEDYPIPSNTSMRQWAWEFLRRNQDYKDAWSLEDFKDCWTHFGVSSICDPVRDYSIELAAELGFNDHVPLYVVDCFTYPHWEYGRREGMLEHDFLNAVTPSLSGQVTIKFNARFDIDDQLEMARQKLQILRETLKAFKKDILSFERTMESQYPLYLRLLDAVDQEKLESDRLLIARAKPVLASREKDEAPDFPVTRRLEANLEQARFLRDFGYRFMPLRKHRNTVDHMEDEPIVFANLGILEELEK